MNTIQRGDVTLSLQLAKLQFARHNHQPEQERIAYLEKKVQTKDEVLAELMAEHVALKKVLGSFEQELGAA